MTSTMKRSSLVFALVSASLWALGCGPAAPPPPAAAGLGEPHGGHHGEHGGHHGEHRDHPKLTGAAHEFHEVLAPLWHAEKSPEREKKTCEAIPAFEQRGAALDSHVPEAASGNEAAYHGAVEGLLKAVGELKAECGKAEGSRGDFEAKFHALHEAFHKVIEKPR